METLKKESIVYNEDCMIGMARYPDKYFDLAVVDPPYGIGIHKMNYTQSLNGGVAKRRDYSAITEWDENAPPPEYFLELMRVSKNQIIWGGNYFALPLTKSWVVWDKRTQSKYSNDFADGELAWTSYDLPLKMFRWLWSGMMQQNMKHKQERIHPTEKPIALYEWIYMNYLPNGGKVIDTHLGSGSNRIAADKQRNIDFYGWEIDKDYFDAQEKRWQDYKSQLTLF